MNIICSIFMLLGAAFTLIAAIGVIRFPDLLLRMHAATKAGTMGVGLILIGVMLHFMSVEATIKSLVTIIFIFMTVPIGAHMIARASYFINIPIWKGTIIDELRDHYNVKTHELISEHRKKVDTK
ncbi:MAG: monovalent cation/H(+) antiporter subunit G [Pseudomonadota bacterium]